MAEDVEPTRGIIPAEIETADQWEAENRLMQSAARGMVDDLCKK